MAKISRTGKALCNRCQRLATGEGRVHRSEKRLACLQYCSKHSLYVGDFKPLGYYSQHFSWLDEICAREDVCQLNYCTHPYTRQRMSLVDVVCSLLDEHDLSRECIETWLHSIARQPGCIKFSNRKELSHEQSEVGLGSL